jgi:hypothetical protein
LYFPERRQLLINSLEELLGYYRRAETQAQNEQTLYGIKALIKALEFELQGCFNEKENVKGENMTRLIINQYVESTLLTFTQKVPANSTTLIRGLHAMILIIHGNSLNDQQVAELTS